jgi:MFS transporter, PAT family, beta-lactamase induction signal transducer AmpG
MHMSERPGAPVGPPAVSPERPWLFGLLIAPSAVLSNGVIGGTLSYLLRRQGIGPARGAEIIALLNLPQTIYFLWSPVTDFWMRRRTWLIVAATAGAAAMVAAFQQPTLGGTWAVGLMFLSACLAQLIVAGCGGMMGTLQVEANRRRAGSFYQSGSLAFGAISVFVLVSLSARVQVGLLGWLIAAMIAIPSLAALAAPEQRTVGGLGLGKTLERIWHEFKATFLRWEAIPYTLLIVFPMGSGAMIQLLPGLAIDYQISGRQVAWINGVAGALLMAAGALAATLISTRIRAPVAFLSVCLMNEASLAVLWLGPLRPFVYLVGTVWFLFTIGTSYALFTGVVLEFLGNSGKSGSARYSIINSLGNIPLTYMLLIDGKSYARWGARAMPGMDVIVGVLGGAILLAYFLSRRSGKQSSAEYPEVAAAP